MNDYLITNVDQLELVVSPRLARYIRKYAKDCCLSDAEVVYAVVYGVYHSHDLATIHVYDNFKVQGKIYSDRNIEKVVRNYLAMKPDC